MLSCVVLIGKGGIVVMGVCLCRFCLNIKVVGDIGLFRVSQGTTGCSGECCFVMTYGEWYGVCGFAVLVVEVCVDYGNVNVFQVCLDFFASSVVLGFVSMSMVLYVVCFLRLGVCCVVM